MFSRDASRIEPYFVGVCWLSCSYVYYHVPSSVLLFTGLPTSPLSEATSCLLDCVSQQRIHRYVKGLAVSIGLLCTRSDLVDENK